MDRVLLELKKYLSDLYIPKVQVIDIIEILILAVLIYYCIVWIKSTRAYTLLKGLLVIALFVILAELFQMTTILWIMKNAATVALTALLVIFQPELRKALEQLGQKNMFSSIIPFDTTKEEDERFSDKTINEIVRAVYDMSDVKTGALIVIELKILLTEYINTGIFLDSLITSQLLLNIFEHNTPLHDGAVIVRGDRVTAATCYLPLSDSMAVSKQLGTRHRAALGISEVSDSFTIVVSEETGRVSYAYGGKLVTSVPPSELREQLHKIQKNKMEEKKTVKFKIWKGRDKDEKSTDE
ncbi:MAG: diadenylate cyclase CdaA [Lachnospiraceae bacterium]|nr:diadenylate cyclase CdaA [Lachnospiraceae bacterium]